MNSMSQEINNVKNFYFSAQADGDKLTMSYKVQEGVIDRSYDIIYAELLKFPQEVIDEAKKLAEKLESFNKWLVT